MSYWEIWRCCCRENTKRFKQLTEAEAYFTDQLNLVALLKRSRRLQLSMLALLSDTQRRKIRLIPEQHRDARHYERSLAKSETMHLIDLER